ncbi:class I SAM-dependent RNA methyltransferase [Hyphomicrobium sp.]|uniref:THUMP domain-containing class I SAM-dependent RNA methyltransferase n=1 Tax=Hyphomicrobium sp. TaxID=82 RepID=UPI0025B9029C|nr:class I SAM-dependent RNA methyltransferase [Hyphomicrobium sp.]MCC7251713.1 class I SAM-dependent RNA methyltransferase [Hyphomicrobium sp.]
MKANGDFEIFLATAPGLEGILCEEVKAHGFRAPRAVPGGVRIEGRWHDVWRANLVIRGASRILARLGSFRATHLSQIEARARQLPWLAMLRRDEPVRVEAACTRSRIYHTGAVAERVGKAIHDVAGVPVSADAALSVAARFEKDICTLSIDTSGALLHKRGFKVAVAKAPLRENLAALFLRQCGYDGTEPVVDPMCGSGTFVIEAAEIAAGLPPGRARSFAFERLATFDAEAWQELRDAQTIRTPAVRFFGSDRDPNAVAMSRANAERAGVAHLTVVQQCAASALAPPDGPPGLVIVNPPYGARLGDRKKLQALYRALGQTLMSKFAGWRVGLVTSDAALANATRLPFLAPSAPVAHGGLRITLFQTHPLA